MASIIRALTSLERFSSNSLQKHVRLSYSVQFERRKDIRSLINRSDFRQTRSVSNAASVNLFTFRTHTCGEINLDQEGKNVTICGWLQYQRMGLFAILKDAYGITQLLIPPTNTEAIELLRTVSFESLLKVSGVVTKRPEGQENAKMPTGAIEVVVDNIELLNKSSANLPFLVRDYIKVKESLRMQYRYLDLRSNKLQRTLRLRSQFLMKVRELLCNELGFVEVETPTLFRRTPGGAQEFIVPTQHIGKCYSLTQSPQQFKQLLMIGGIDRYFQIAKCYRDEGAKPDRQPEFTQLDLELSYTDENSIMALIERILAHSWLDKERNITIPFKRLTYKEAMIRYGSDKPDTRFGMELHDLTDDLRNADALAIISALSKAKHGVVRAVCVSKGSEHLTLKIRGQFAELAQSKFRVPGLTFIKVKEKLKWTGELNKHISTEIQDTVNNKLGIKDGDIIILAAGEDSGVTLMMGYIRLQIATLLEEKGIELRSKNDVNFLWITDFPLFFKTNEGLFETAHHPFSSPHLDDLHLLKSNPEKVRSRHYDLVLNGVEIGGGSIRIHDAATQRYILEQILKEPVSEMEYFLTALQSGCPPHGGIALGIDRLLTILFDVDTIRDVMAFPKSHLGFDLMSNAPAPLSEKDAQLYGLKINDKQEEIICNKVINQ